MKHEGIFNFLGAGVIAAAIVISGVIIASKMPETPHFPSSLSVSASDDTQFGDYLSLYDAAAYLKVDIEYLQDQIDSGELDSVIYKIGENYIISKQALRDWVDSRIGK